MILGKVVVVVVQLLAVVEAALMFLVIIVVILAVAILYPQLLYSIPVSSPMYMKEVCVISCECVK